MKTSTKLSDYNKSKPTFKSFFSKDDDERSKELMNIYNNSLKVRGTKKK